MTRKRCLVCGRYHYGPELVCASCPRPALPQGRETVAWVDSRGYLLCDRCVQPHERGSRVHRGDLPHALEPCDRCGRIVSA
jgi:hypothetical protein